MDKTRLIATLVHDFEQDLEEVEEMNKQELKWLYEKLVKHSYTKKEVDHNGSKSNEK